MCPSGWLYSNDHCYKHFSEASKEDANRICLKHNSFLLKIENELEKAAQPINLRQIEGSRLLGNIYIFIDYRHLF